MTAMRYRRIIAAALCLTLLCGTGCSLGKKKDSSSSVSAEIGYSYSSSKKTKYEFKDFTFELSDDFTVEDKNTYPQDGTPYDFKFAGKGFTSFEVNDSALSNCDAFVSAKMMYDDLSNDDDENRKVSDLEWEKLDLPGLDAAWVHLTTEHVKEGITEGEAVLYISTEAHYFKVLLSYEDPAKRPEIKGLLMDIANSVKYTSEDRLPTEPQTFDCDYFTLTYPPEWSVKETNGSKNDPNSIELKIEYAYARDEDHYLFPRLSIDVDPLDEDSDPVKRADKSASAKKQSKYAYDIERGQDEILGYKAETSSYKMDAFDLKGTYRNYFFSENGCLYVITLHARTDIADTHNAELEELLKGLTIKKMSGEELEKHKQSIEAAKYTEHTMASAGFTLNSKFKAGSTNGKYDSRFSNSDEDMYLYICRKADTDYNGAFQEYFEKKCSRISFSNDLDGVYSKKVILGDKNFEDIFYTEKAESGEEPKKHSIYLFDRGDEIWEFDMSYNEKDEEKAVGYLEEMLWTLKFDN